MRATGYVLGVPRGTTIPAGIPVLKDGEYKPNFPTLSTPITIGVVVAVSADARGPFATIAVAASYQLLPRLLQSGDARYALRWYRPDSRRTDGFYPEGSVLWLDALPDHRPEARLTAGHLPAPYALRWPTRSLRVLEF